LEERKTKDEERKKRLQLAEKTLAETKKPLKKRRS